jgi:16S rRNA processing protein RimM
VLVGQPPLARRVERQRVSAGRVVLKLAGIDNREAAEVLRGALISVPAEQAVALPAGTYYWHQIIGLRVVDLEDRPLGQIADILATGGNDVYVVRSNGRELLLPAIRDVVKEIDLDGGVVRVDLLPGLEG